MCTGNLICVKKAYMETEGMTTDNKRIMGFIFVLGLLVVVAHGTFSVANCEALNPSADSSDVLRKQIRALEEKVRTLEVQLQEALKDKAVTGENIHIQSIQTELSDLRDEIESLKLSLDMQQDRMARVKISGEERVRFMSIDTHGAQAIGAYGEELKEETTLKHYLRLETRVAISKNLIAGALLRITNVGETVLNEGPEYLSQEWGSAFLKYSRKEFNCIAGAYDIHLTPFTLMRWDQEDNPEGGGEAGGGCLPCGGIAGAIPRESLEELSPRLTFEGARLNGMLSDFVDVTAFYAQPWQFPSNQHYRNHLFGARAKVLSYHRPSTSFRHLGLTVLTTRDEASSITKSQIPSKLKEQPPAFENNVIGADINFPITESLLLRGEWTYTEVKLDSLVGDDENYNGQAFLLGFKLQYPEYVKFRCSYLHLEKYFESHYRAVSYMTNRQGIRSSLTVEIPRWNASVSSFVKVLKEIDPVESCDCEDELQTFYVASLGVSVVPVKNLLVRPSFIYRSTRRDEGIYLGKIRDNTYLFIGEMIFTLFKDNEFILRYQYIDSEDKVNPTLDYTAETIFTLFSLKF